MMVHGREDVAPGNLWPMTHTGRKHFQRSCLVCIYGQIGDAACVCFFFIFNLLDTIEQMDGR